jgi:hypothetical protein
MNKKRDLLEDMALTILEHMDAKDIVPLLKKEAEEYIQSGGKNASSLAAACKFYVTKHFSEMSGKSIKEITSEMDAMRDIAEKMKNAKHQ